MPLCKCSSGAWIDYLISFLQSKTNELHCCQDFPRLPCHCRVLLIVGAVGGVLEKYPYDSKNLGLQYKLLWMTAEYAWISRSCQFDCMLVRGCDLRPQLMEGDRHHAESFLASF